MATHFGSDASVKLVTTGGAVATVGEVQSWSTSNSNAPVESTSMGDTSRTYVKGISEGTASITMHLDPDDAAQADLLEGDQVDCEFYMEGTASGDQKLSGTYFVTSVERGATFDGIATLSAELQLNGAFTIGTV